MNIKQEHQLQNFVFYDFNQPEEIPSNQKNSFDMAIIDPPFITEDVWSKYAITIKCLLKPQNNFILASSILENEEMLRKFLQIEPKKYQPSIPNLIYQYNFYSNYDSPGLNNLNNEIPQ